MQLRQIMSSFRAPKKQHPRRKSMEELPLALPVYVLQPNGMVAPPLRTWASSKWMIHAIPLAVFLCFFTLWWFSYPVLLEIKDGKIAAIHRVDIPMNVTHHVELVILATSKPPVAPLPLNLTEKHETEALHPANNTA